MIYDKAQGKNGFERTVAISSGNTLKEQMNRDSYFQPY